MRPRTTSLLRQGHGIAFDVLPAWIGPNADAELPLGHARRRVPRELDALRGRHLADRHVADDRRRRLQREPSHGPGRRRGAASGAAGADATIAWRAAIVAALGLGDRRRGRRGRARGASAGSGGSPAGSRRPGRAHRERGRRARAVAPRAGRASACGRARARSRRGHGNRPSGRSGASHSSSSFAVIARPRCSARTSAPWARPTISKAPASAARGKTRTSAVTPADGSGRRRGGVMRPAGACAARPGRCRPARRRPRRGTRRLPRRSHACCRCGWRGRMWPSRCRRRSRLRAETRETARPQCCSCATRGAAASGSALLPACDHSTPTVDQFSEREARVPGKFVVKKGPTGKFRFSLVSTNGQVVVSSQAYETKRAALGGIASVQKLAAGATLVDTTAAGEGAAKPAARSRPRRSRPEETGGEEAGREEAGRQEVGRRKPPFGVGSSPRGSPDADQPVGRDRSRSTVRGSARCIRLACARATSASRSSATISPTAARSPARCPRECAERSATGRAGRLPRRESAPRGRRRCGPDVPARAASSSAGQSTTAGARDEHHHRAWAIAVEAIAADAPAFSVVTGARMKTTRVRAKSSARVPARRPAPRSASSASQGSWARSRSRTAGAAAAATRARLPRRRRGRPFCREQERAAVDDRRRTWSRCRPGSRRRRGECRGRRRARVRVRARRPAGPKTGPIPSTSIPRAKQAG